MRLVGILMMFLFGWLLIVCGFRGRVGSLMAAFLAPNALVNTPT